MDRGPHSVVIPMVGFDHHDLTYRGLTHCRHEAEVLLLLKPAVHKDKFVLSRVLPSGLLLGGGVKLLGATDDAFQLAFLACKFNGISLSVITFLIVKAVSPSLAVRPVLDPDEGPDCPPDSR